MSPDANELGAQPANPMPVGVNLPASGTYAASPIDGLTKREAFAMAMLQGLLSNPGGPVQASATTGWQSTTNCTREIVAQEAVAYADALLEELAKEARNVR